MNGPGAPEAGDVVSELTRLADAAALRAFLVRTPALLRPDVVRELAETVRHEVRVNVERSLLLADAALTIANVIGDPESIGFGSRAKANALWFGGSLRPAIELFHAAASQFERAGAIDEVGRTLSSSIQPLILLGEYVQALQSAGRAREIFQRTGDLLRLGRLEINVANIHHRQDRFAEALLSYERAYEQLEPYKDQEAMAAALHNMAVCLIALNDFDRALETYHRARKVSGENQMPLVALQADYNIAYLYFLRGDYQTALDALHVARARCEENGNEYHLALCDLDESEICLELNLSHEAGVMARRARERFEKLGIAFEAGRSTLNFAIALHAQRKSAAALDLFAKAGEVFAREGNAACQALVGLYRALVLWETGDAERAAPVCRDALRFFIANGLERRAILCHLLLARLSAAQGRFSEAQEHCQAALQKLTAVEAPLLNYHAHLIMGDLYGSCGTPRRGYPCYRKARRNLEALRARLQGEELKIAFMNNRTVVYEKLVGISLRENRRRSAVKAFRYMERAKSRSLLEAVFSRTSPAPWPVDGPEGELIRRLRHELNWYYRRLEIEQTRAEGISVAQIQQLQAEARSREDQLVRAMRGLHPAGQDENAVQASGSVTLDELHAALGDATLVEYFQVGSRLIAAIVAGGDLEIAELGDITHIDSSTRMLDFHLSQMSVKALRGREHAQAQLKATQSRLRELYHCLLAPLAHRFRGQRLVIAPHGLLHYVPFHALSDGDEYLIDRFTVSYTPSAGIYAVCRRRRANCNGPSLLLGVDDKRAPWIRREIRSVAEVLPDPEIRLGPQATAAVLRNAGASSRFIHIATHGTFRRDNPMFSSVRLADSYLNIYDLYQLRLPAELVTLSGCGTGLSVVAAGDELLGLIRGLLSAGAQSLLLTLWDVHDRTTAEFMRAFYSRLPERSDKGLALREAMLELRKTHPHPYYWAPFMLVGSSFSVN